MVQVIGLKQLRERVDDFAKEVKKGKSFIVVRRSRPLFKISPPEEETELWERVADFTKIRKGGIPLKDILSRL